MLTPLIDQYHILFSSLSMLVSLMFGSLLLFSTELIHYTIFTGALRPEQQTCVQFGFTCISNDKMHFGH